jgi:hypothetical protein
MVSHRHLNARLVPATARQDESRPDAHRRTITVDIQWLAGTRIALRGLTTVSTVK